MMAGGDMDEAKLRAWWADKQGLLREDSSLTPAGVFAKSGWCRSLAGCNPYLTAFTRAGLRRKDVDEAVKELEISELPAARGCTYVVPKEQFGTALSVAGTESGDLKTAINLGATREEIANLSELVVQALDGEAKDPAALKKELGDAVRNFGEVGKKKGLTTSLPLALGMLQSEGRVIRRPVSGRLDEQRYAYAAWTKNRPELSLTKDQAMAALAADFFRWIGPASLAEFSVLAGISLKGAKVATIDLNLVAAPGFADLLILADEVDAFNSFTTPVEPKYSLINCLDSLLLFHTDYTNLFTPNALEQVVRYQTTKSTGSGLRELQFNAIVDRGTVVGLWEFDSLKQELAFVSFEPMNDRLKAEIERTERFIQEDLGDARTFSLDSPKSRQPKIDRLRAG